jgi:hypothetical protein
MGDVKPIYFGALWKDEEKDMIKGSMSVEELGDILTAATNAEAEKVYIMVYPNDNKEKDSQPDFNLVHYPDSLQKKKSWGGNKPKTPAKPSRFGKTKKSSMF